MFLRINTSLDDENLKLDKLVVHVTCCDCRRPLHLVKGTFEKPLGVAIMLISSLDS